MQTEADKNHRIQENESKTQESEKCERILELKMWNIISFVVHTFNISWKL